MLTEEQARTKWCPFAQVEYDKFPVNRLYSEPNPGACHCNASDCMAWRWFVETEQTEGSTSTVPERGYCGLAGRPEAG